MCSEGPKDFEDGSGGQSPVEKDVYKLYPSWVLLSKDLIAVDPCAGDGPDDEQLQETVTSSSVKKDDRAVRTASPARNSVDLARDGSNDELEHANLPPLSKATSSDDLASTGKNGVDHDDCVGCVGAGSTENADEIAASTPAGVVEPVLGRTHSFKHYPSWILLSVRDNVRDRAGTAGDAEQEQDARPAASDGITAEVLPVKRRKSLWKRTKRFLTNCFGRCSCTNPPVRCD